MNNVFEDVLTTHLDRINDHVSECTLMDEATEAVQSYCVDWGLDSTDFVVKAQRNGTFKADLH